MHLQKMDLNHHNPYKIGELIYEADAETFDFFFGNKKNASLKLGKLVKTGENNLGNEHTYVVTNDDQEIMGVMVCSAGKRMGTVCRGRERCVFCVESGCGGAVVPLRGKRTLMRLQSAQCAVSRKNREEEQREQV